MTPDLGAPSSYLALPAGVPVYASDGEQAGRVEHVLAAEDADIFDGLVVRIGGRRAFVDATLIAGLYERGAVLTIDAGAVTRLPEPSANPPALRATPGDTTPDGLARKLRRAWDVLSGRP
ncbi:MAG TPA: hypothetical protein VLA98_09205 [Solirubrobacteraceae bacterium]|nr:hypothetical protein [Solirubrobacteraceae bacterium]